jgi:hypothetical protein
MLLYDRKVSRAIMASGFSAVSSKLEGGKLGSVDSSYAKAAFTIACDTLFVRQ